MKSAGNSDFQFLRKHSPSLKKLSFFTVRGPSLVWSSKFLIQGFEYTHELSSSTMRDYLACQGPVTITGSRDAIRDAFKRGLISEGHAWMDMIRGRNLSCYTYNETSAQKLVDDIVYQYFPLFHYFREKMLETPVRQE